MYNFPCGSTTREGVDLLTGEVKANAIWCKSWHCEHCAQLRQKQLMAQAAQGKPTKFITLTSRYRPDEMTPDEAARELVHAWRMVIQRGKRDGLIKEMQYIAVFELTKKGWPHLHILARCDFLVQSWLAARLEQYANSPIVDVRAVKSQKRAAWYVAKYTAKAPEKFQGCKRYWRTKSYAPEDTKKQPTVHDHFQAWRHPFDVRVLAASYTAYDYLVTWDGERSFIAWPSSIDLHETRRKNYHLGKSPPTTEPRLCT